MFLLAFKVTHYISVWTLVNILFQYGPASTTLINRFYDMVRIK